MAALSSYPTVSTLVSSDKIPVSRSGGAGIDNIAYSDFVTQILTSPAITNPTLSGTTGIKLGSAVTDKVSFYGGTAIVQPSGAGQAAAAAQTQTSLTDNSAGTASTTLAAVAGMLYTTDVPTLRNWIASVAAELALIKTDVANIKTLQDATRTALVNLGAIKGAA